MNPADLPIRDAAAALRKGYLTAVDLVQAHFDRIAARDPILHAFVLITADRALAEAATADVKLTSGRDCGPLHGIPPTVKDVIDVAGLPTTFCSRAVSQEPAGTSAVVTRRLAEAGAVMLGKLATYEFALVGPSFDLDRPPAANPWNPAHCTGGSSSDSAAAVAGGLIRAALGTDTGGSLRSPAAYCGVVGLKLTAGRVPHYGVFPVAPSLDAVGPIAATVAEAALLLDAIADPGPSSAARLGEPVEGLRIGYARAWFAGDLEVSPAVVAALDAAASTLLLLGTQVEEATLPDYEMLEACGVVVLHSEALAVHQESLRTRADYYGSPALQTLLSGACLTPSDLDRARRLGCALAAEIDATLAGCDAILTASTLTPALPFAAFDGSAVWTPMRTLPFNLTGHPTLAVPAGSTGGLPLGLQLVAGRGEEVRFVQIGHAFEQATDHAVQKPPLPENRMVSADA